MSRKKKVLSAVAVVVLFLLAALGIAAANRAEAATMQLSRAQLTAATSTTLAGNTRAVCVSSTGQMGWFEMSQVPHTCASGLTLIPWNTTGTQGPTGPAGPAGPAGAQGPSGIVSVGTHDLGAVASVATGGPFATNATDVGTVSLAAGTYQVTVNAKATPPAAGTGTVEEFPQFFVYNGVAQVNFSNDLFNVGAGALESGTNHTIDSYYSGTDTVTLSAASTLHFYAFGYNSNTGAGTYILDDLSVTVVQLTPAA